MILTLLVFLIILSLIVLIHELGHFLVAKKFGIKVEEFGFGFPPRLFGIKKGETVYSINWLPIGGFVKLYGEDEAGGGRVDYSSNAAKRSREDSSPQGRTIKDIDRTFFAKSPWSRAAVCVAGVVMNFLLAIILSYVYFGFTNFRSVFPCIGNPHYVLGSVTRMCDVVIIDVQKNTPAEKAGIKPNSKVVQVNNVSLSTSLEPFSQIIVKNKGKNVTILLEDKKTKQQYTVNVVPRTKYPNGQGALGVVFSGNPFIVVSYTTPTQKIFSGIAHPVNTLLLQGSALGQLFSESSRTKNIAPLADNVSGPIGIGLAVGKVMQIPDKQEMYITLLSLMILLSTTIGFMNILPIPALDGGRLFFILIEAVTGKKLNPDIEAKIHMAGMYLLLGLILLFTMHDIKKWVTGGI